MGTVNPEIKAKWVAALRSGDFTQGVGNLAFKPDPESGMRHCCLGVLCELAIEDGVVEASSRNLAGNTKVRQYGKDDRWSVTDLPAPVVEWAELDGPDPKLFTHEYQVNGQWGHRQVTCSMANDGSARTHDGSVKSHTFAKIADLIEANF